jgi:hypothetical protein
MYNKPPISDATDTTKENIYVSSNTPMLFYLSWDEFEPILVKIGSINSMNKGAETKYRVDSMEIQYDQPSKYTMRKRTFKATIPTQNPSKKKSRLFCISRQRNYDHPLKS